MIPVYYLMIFEDKEEPGPGPGAEVVWVNNNGEKIRWVNANNEPVTFTTG